MNITEIKTEIFRQVNSLDSSKLEEFYGVLLNYQNSKNEADEWIGLTDREIKGIEAAIQELDAGKGIPHAQVMSKQRQKYAQG